MTLTKLPRLAIDCFRDDTRETLGRWDASEPSDPTPDLPPDDPIEITKRAIKKCKDEIMGYDGLCYAGEKAVLPGRWYKQPIYPVMLCESDTIQPDLIRFQKDRSVRVGCVRRWTSTGIIYEFCKEVDEKLQSIIG